MRVWFKAEERVTAKQCKLFQITFLLLADLPVAFEGASIAGSDTTFRLSRFACTLAKSWASKTEKKFEKFSQHPNRYQLQNPSEQPIPWLLQIEEHYCRLKMLQQMDGQLCCSLLPEHLPWACLKL